LASDWMNCDIRGPVLVHIQFALACIWSCDCTCHSRSHCGRGLTSWTWTL
jgi:hypothetical protein